eukprot:15441095-Alexandrium_andersonii.AAC.1
MLGEGRRAGAARERRAPQALLSEASRTGNLARKPSNTSAASPARWVGERGGRRQKAGVRVAGSKRDATVKVAAAGRRVV